MFRKMFPRVNFHGYNVGARVDGEGGGNILLFVYCQCVSNFPRCSHEVSNVFHKMFPRVNFHGYNVGARVGGEGGGA